MSRLVLAKTLRSPMQLLDIDTGISTSIPSALDNVDGMTFAMARDGWVAIGGRDELFGYRDGNLSQPTLLPPAKWILPARHPDEILLSPHLDTVPADWDYTRLVAVGVDGHVRRSTSVPMDIWPVVGEQTEASFAPRGFGPGTGGSESTQGIERPSESWTVGSWSTPALAR